MAKLYYGGGNCSIEGNDIRGVEIRYIGAIEIEDKTDSNFALIAKNNGIIIFPIGEGSLSELFDYVGEFKITSVIVADNNAEKVSTTIHRVMDYSELLGTSESITTNSEDLKVSNVSGRKVNKTALKQPNLNNQHTSRHDGELFLQDGTEYSGYFHIHLSDNSAMTGAEHTEDSQDLYFNHGKPTKNPKLIPYGAIKQKEIKKAIRLKNRRSRNRRR